MGYKILVVEDDTLFAHTLQDLLEEEGYEVVLARNAEEALARNYDTSFHCYILDVKLPDVDGFSLLRELRSSGDRTPALFLTSKDTPKEGFLAGGDDFVTKPCDIEELLLRLRALLRRSWGEYERIGSWHFDRDAKMLRSASEQITLTPKEAKLLELLLAQRGYIVPKERIFEELWEDSAEASDAALRVYINELKKYLGKESIVNIRGVGYKLEA